MNFITSISDDIDGWVKLEANLDMVRHDFLDKLGRLMFLTTVKYKAKVEVFRLPGGLHNLNHTKSITLVLEFERKGINKVAAILKSLKFDISLLERNREYVYG